MDFVLLESLHLAAVQGPAPARLEGSVEVPVEGVRLGSIGLPPSGRVAIVATPVPGANHAPGGRLVPDLGHPADLVELRVRPGGLPLDRRVRHRPTLR